MNRYTKVRELVKDPSLTIKNIAQQTGYDKGHVSRLRKEFLRQTLYNESGMSLRDYFAAKAMQGFIDYAAATGRFAPPDNQLAQCSYDVADAMLKAREK
jgi:hypothetical protein